MQSEKQDPISSFPRPQKSGCLGKLVLIFFILIAIGLVLTALGKFLVVADPLEHSDAVVILSGDTEGRMGEAVEIYKEELTHLFVLTETGQQLQGYDQKYIDYLVERAVEMGIPTGAIRVTEEHSQNTYDEAQAVLILLERYRVESAIIVTDPFHTRRTQLIFNEVFKESGIKVSVRPVRGHWYSASTWWLSLRGWEATIQEYIRLFSYWIGIR
jgi:uncharacterized SAM-binding protein YcdF (DUF218 family)